ncbi:heavy metal transporter [Cellulosimicrobium sp. Marseille-Q4280]|uniref:heavy metal transporter n=1 Tax=Cellulosimicrobium sp. Marseille-Q4280 TaxID=2937992 RepID=UPI00203D043E|nr:heavy metal transporter [Cellulosimicrobium sp. Marseille-Q4280]
MSDPLDDRRARRVRVRSTDPAPPAGPGAPALLPDPAPSGTTARPPRAVEAGDDVTVYARSLARAQLRLALACAGTFLVAVLLLALLVTTTSALDEVVVAGVPLPWLVHAYGFYPVIVAFAVVFAVAAARNERRFRALAEPDDAPGEQTAEDA